MASAVLPNERSNATRVSAGTWAALAALLLAACSSSTKPGEEPVALPALKSPLPVEVLWHYRVGDGRGAFLQPAILDNAVFAASTDGTVVRLNPADGKVAWEVRAPGRIGAGVGSDGFAVVVAGQRGEVYALAADGKLSWQSRVPSDVVTAPLVGHGLVIVRSTDQAVTAFESDSGRKRWTFKRQTPPLTLRGATELAFDGENVIVGFPGGRLVAVALSNGAARWDSGVSEPKGSTEVERLADVLGSIGLDDSHVCAATYQGRVACFDAASGEEQWARELAAGAGVAIDADQLFSVDSAATVHAFSMSNGAGVWANKSLAYRSLSSPAIAGRWIVVGDYRGYVHFLDRHDGDLVGRVDLDGSPIVVEPRRLGGGVLVQTQRGELALLAARG